MEKYVSALANIDLPGILGAFSWRMDPPPLFGGFHFAASLMVTAAAVLMSRYAVSKIRKREDSISGILFICGLILLLLEVFKQLFLYYIVNSEIYDWWFFPFQLCSVPMYMCLLTPLTGGGARKVLLSFMTAYTFLGAAAALIYPEDILRAYVVLTVHGFIWHGILLFISITCGMSGAADLSPKGFARATMLFILLCILAVSINIIAEPLAQASGLPNTYAAMFYLNPYHISPQPFIGSVQKAAGIPAGLILYICVIIAISGSVNAAFSFISAAGRKSVKS